MLNPKIVTRTALPADTWKSEDFCHGGKRQHARTAAAMVRMLLLMAGIAAVLADPTTPPVAEKQQPAAAEAPVATEEDVVARSGGVSLDCSLFPCVCTSPRAPIP